MAKRPPRAGRGAPAAPARAKAKSRRPSEVEVVEESAGIGLDAGLAIATTLVLLASIVFVDMLLGKFGSGMFFS